MNEYTWEIKDKMYDAVESGELSRIQPLLQQHGPELAAADLDDVYDWTALHIIAFDAPDGPASAESIQHLAAIEAVDIDVCGYAGMTPLHWASVYGKVHHVRALLRCGADRYAENDDGDTPASDCCTENAANKPIILSLLKNPPRTYIQELIDKRNILAMILNKRISIGTKQDINQMLISIGY